MYEWLSTMVFLSGMSVCLSIMGIVMFGIFVAHEFLDPYNENPKLVTCAISLFSIIALVGLSLWYHKVSLLNMDDFKKANGIYTLPSQPQVTETRVTPKKHKTVIKHKTKTSTKVVTVGPPLEEAPNE